MPYALTRKTTLDDCEETTLDTRAALEADPDASELLPLTDGWMEEIDKTRAVERTTRKKVAQANARRRVSNTRLDMTCGGFADELHLAVNKDHTSARWLTFFAVAVGLFVRQALSRQVAAVRGWLTSNDAVLEKHRPALTFWSGKAQEALDETVALATAHGEAHVAREHLAEFLTRGRDGLHDALSGIARQKGFAREWPDAFFQVQSRSKKRLEEPEAPPAPATPPAV